MRVLGLTGGIGSGKSTVAELFAQHGVPIIDTDQIAHALSRPPSPTLAEIAHAFGAEYVDAEQGLHREKMRKHIFSHPAAKQKLEAILHPAIHAAAVTSLTALPSSTPYAILVVPLLFETGSYHDLITRTLVVDCDESAQMARTLLRPGLTTALIKAIMAQQWPRQARLANADDVISNNGNLQTLAKQTNDLHQQYLHWANSNESSLTKRVFKT